MSPQSNPTTQTHASNQQNHPNPSSTNPGDSPFDLSSFIAFPTANSIGHLPAGNDELYRAFAQGIKGGAQGTDGAAGNDFAQGQSSGQNQNASQNGQKGDGLSPYGLDPSAFHSSVRFQLPAFLNPTNSRPAYPNGAEAWSGYGNNSTKALEGMYNQNLPQKGQSTQTGNGNNNASGGPFSNGGNQMFPGNNNNNGNNNSNNNWNASSQVGQGTGAIAVGQQGASGAQNGQMPGLGEGHNDAGGLDHWDNWNFSVDNSKPFMSVNSYGYGSNPMAQTPYSVNGPMQNTGRSTSSGISQVMGSGGGHDVSMPTSALLPNSAYPDSSAFASSSRMTFGQDNTPVGQLSGNGQFQSSDENAFASSSSGNTAPAAASLIASNGLGGLVNPGTLATTTPAGPNMPGLYSTTGFDIVSVLAKVAGRSNPKTVLGPVDCSCSFVVSDVRKFDCPIVYTSPTFSQLTGYEAREILGRNCRFLQSPDADVAKGSRRKYTDNVAVAHMKRLLQAGKECQASLINYRKGGTPFINLVTVVPITWDSDEIAYHVGFQVDLVEQPNAILRNMRDGSYQVNYTVQNNPEPPMKPAAKPIIAPPPPSSIGISQEQLSLLSRSTQTAVLAGGEEVGKFEWLKLVLGETDDFVHVLSLKGQFQYVSPSVRKVLEYDPEELINKHISDICHPSDIVPVMRELKDATHTPSDGRQPQPINMLFRVRRKRSGYIWLESSGRVQIEAGKGRKAMVLTGRERSIPAFCWKALDDHGGLGDTEVWAKVSLDGLILWTTGAVNDLFGTRPNDLIGKSLYAFMAGGDNGPPGPDGHSSALAVEKAISNSADGLPKRGTTSVRHQIIGMDGRTREVQSNFFAAGSSSAGPITPPRESPETPDDDLRSNSSAIIEALPFQIMVQIKSAPSGIQKPKTAIMHPLTENVFEEMDTTRGTSWQYEVHQLKTANRKLKDEIRAFKTSQRGSKNSDAEAELKKAKNKKRKANESGPQPTTDHPTPLHQQTPGFGLATGQLYKTWS